jgi:hypothetical protein
MIKRIFALALCFLVLPLSGARWMVWNNAFTFTPQDLGSQLVAWYDGSNLGLPNGTAVSTFTDRKTGAPYSLTGGTNPTQNTGIQNGKAAVLFNGTSTIKNIGGSSSSTLPYTIWATLRWDSTGPAYQNFIGSTNVSAQGNTGLAIDIDTAAANVRLLSQNTTLFGASTGGLFTGNTWHSVIITVDSGNYAFYIDGTLAGSGTGSFSLGASKTFCIGALDDTVPSIFFKGYIGEIGICNAVLNSTDRGNLVTYQRNTWATP